MLRWYPYVPIGGEMGINVAILSDNGVAYVGFSVDVHAAPDLELWRSSSILASTNSRLPQLRNPRWRRRNDRRKKPRPFLRRPRRRSRQPLSRIAESHWLCGKRASRRCSHRILGQKRKPSQNWHRSATEGQHRSDVLAGTEIRQPVCTSFRPSPSGRVDEPAFRRHSSKGEGKAGSSTRGSSPSVGMTSLGSI